MHGENLKLISGLFFERKKNSLTPNFRNPSSGSPIIPCGLRDRRTDRHEEASNRYSKFFERV